MSKEVIKIDKILYKCESISWKPCFNDLAKKIDKTLNEDEKKLLRENAYASLVRAFECSAITTFRYIYEKCNSNLTNIEFSNLIGIIKGKSAYTNILVRQFLANCEQYQQATIEGDEKSDGVLCELIKLRVKAWLFFEIEINVVIEAVKQDNPHALQLILKKLDFSTNMNKCDCYGNYAIDLAAIWGLKKCVEVLLFHISRQGQGKIQFSVAFKYARDYGHHEIVKLFEGYQQSRGLKIYQNLETLNAAFYSGFISESDYFFMVRVLNLDIKKALLNFIGTISKRLVIHEHDERLNSHCKGKDEFDSLVLPKPIIQFCHTLKNKPLLKSGLKNFSSFTQKTEKASNIHVIENLDICIQEMIKVSCPCRICKFYFVILLKSKASIKNLCGELYQKENNIGVSTSSDEKMKTSARHKV